MTPLHAFYAFQHEPVSGNIVETICRFCGQHLACSDRLENLLIVEEHHSCLAMRNALMDEVARKLSELDS